MMDDGWSRTRTELTSEFEELKLNKTAAVPIIITVTKSQTQRQTDGGNQQ
jgi:hypothetical protein